MVNDENLVINENNFSDVFLRKDVLEIIFIKIKSEWAKFQALKMSMDILLREKQQHVKYIPLMISKV